MAIYLMCSSKKGISAHQLHRMLGVTYKSAWFMVHRIRYAMDQSPLKEKLKGKVEADETYVGGYRKGSGGRSKDKEIVVSLVERNGRVKSQRVASVSGINLREVLNENVDPSSILITDDFPTYHWVSNLVSGHQVIKHSDGDYVDGDVYTNTVEGYFSLLKRGINGTFHHVSRTHLHRYLSEFDFRYNYRQVDDKERTVKAIEGFGGKRLYYRQPKAIQTNGTRETSLR
jgi:transposase-like protein